MIFSVYLSLMSFKMYNRNDPELTACSEQYDLVEIDSLESSAEANHIRIKIRSLIRKK